MTVCRLIQSVLAIRILGAEEACRFETGDPVTAHNEMTNRFSRPLNFLAIVEVANGILNNESKLFGALTCN